MVNQMLLSIIVPVYNVSDYLEKCLKSLQKQNFPANVEVILVDDGSTDDSGKICDKFKNNTTPPYFLTIHTKNRGLAAARNIGLKEARGEYIAWVDSDDYITDDWWKIIQPILLKKPDMICFEHKIVQKDRQVAEWHYDSKSRIISHEELVQALAMDKMSSYMWSKILRKSFFDDITFNESRAYYEDYHAMHQLTFPVHECVYLHKSLYVYQLRSNSLTGDKSKDFIRAKYDLEEKKERFKFYEERGFVLDEYPIARAEIHFLSLAIQQMDSLSELKVKYRGLIEHIEKYLSRFYFHKDLEVGASCLLYFLFADKKPLLWVLLRHPYTTVVEWLKLAKKN